MNSGSPSTPSSPYTLSNERYKANVNRTKTRKWVEAKKIDYGGDDWGGDDDFEEDDAGESGSANEPAHSVPQPQQQPHAVRTDRLAGLRAIGDGSGSTTPRSGSAGSARSLRPSERIAMEKHGSGGVQQRNVTAPPALHVYTGVQSQRPVQPPAEQQELSPPAQESPYPPRKSSISQQDKPDLTLESTVQHPPRTSSRSASPGFQSPPAIGSSTSPRIVRPSEIYKRMEEEKDKERKSLDSTRRPSLDSLGSGDGADMANAQRRPSFGRNDGDVNRPLQPLASVAERKSEYGFDGLMIDPGAPPPPQQPKASSDTMTETTKDIETRQDPVASLSSEPALPPTLQYPPQLSDDRPPAQNPPKRYSTSPKLPEFARLSGFGSDFFSGGSGFLGGSGSASPKQPEAPAEATRMPATGSNLGPGSATGVTRTAAEPTRHSTREEEKTAAQIDGPHAALSNTQPPPEPNHPKPFRPSLPGSWVSETPSSTGEMATPFSEKSDKAVTSQMSVLGEHPDHAFMKPAPLRTPTPRDRESFSKIADEDRASTKSKSGRSSPVKPQPLRTTASLLSNVEQSGRTPTQKDYSDAETHQTSDLTQIAPAPLQPRKSAGELAQQDRPQVIARTDTMLTEASTAPQESDVLRDEIIRSLSPARGPSSQLDAQGDTGAARESAYLSDVYGDYWDGGDKRTEDEQHRDEGQVDALATVREDDSPPYAIPAVEPEPVKPGIRRERFSWEASTASPAPSPTKHPLPALPKDEPSPTLEALPLASPVDSGRMSPMLSLPMRGFDRNDEEAIAKDEHTSGDASTLEHGTAGKSATPPSLTLDHETITATSLFSPDSAIMNLDSPTTPNNPYFTAVDPEVVRSDSPTDIPLPRSPSTPTQPTSAAAAAEQGDTDVTPRMSSGDAAQNTMNLKQIMGLPTSPERVYKLHEARAEFATTPTGLAGWLGQLLAMPEHANAGPSFKYAPAGDDLPLFANQNHRARRSQHGTAAAAAVDDGLPGGGAGGGGLAGRRSSVTLGGAGGGSVRIAAGAQAQLGNLMHGPAGAKGKELLQSAGKMGKGLLSKGKSKLRERAESKKGM